MNNGVIDPGWVDVILTILITTIPVAYGVGRRHSTGYSEALSDDQVIAIIQIHENSVISEILRRATIFLYGAEIRGRTITPAQLEELRREVTALVKARRDLLAIFPAPKSTPYQSLEHYLAYLYNDAAIKRDFERFEPIVSSDMSIIEKLERTQEIVYQIQVDLKVRVREDLRVQRQKHS